MRVNWSERESWRARDVTLRSVTSVTGPVAGANSADCVRRGAESDGAASQPWSVSRVSGARNDNRADKGGLPPDFRRQGMTPIKAHLAGRSIMVGS